MTKFNGGFIWSEIRWGIAAKRERLIEAFDAGSFERESAMLDQIARDVTEKIEPMIAEYAERKPRK